jgi:membrane-associated phospholipid phosphatase
MEISRRDGKKFQYIGAAVFVLVVFIYSFIKISQQLNGEDIVKFDQRGISFIQSSITTQLTDWMKVITYLGSVKWITVLVIIAILLLFVRKKIALALFFMISSGFGGLFNLVLKWYFKRERPDILPLISEEGYSFPSGHSMGSFIFYGSLAYVIIHLAHKNSWKWIGCILNGLFIIMIGVSRIYLGVHYPSDIVGGFLAGAAWLIICIILFRYYEYRNNL